MLLHHLLFCKAMASCSDNGEDSRFLKLNSDEKQQVFNDRNTRNATKLCKNLLEQYIIEREIEGTIDTIDDAALPNLLENFYAEIRTKKGHQRYKNSSLKAIRASINRYMKESRGIDIISDPRFVRCNEMFKGVTKQNKAKGKGIIQHKEPISSQDLERLQDYFSRYMKPDATVLQRCVLFNLMFFLCRRGCENLTGMSKDTFAVSTQM